jgi:two-component system copper resistance phosphate regulon response regulator CusR
MSILIIEDNQKLAQNIQRYLQSERYAVALAFDGESGLQRARTETYDLIILDLNLPKRDGLSVCKTLREEGVVTPILMLTARVGTEHVVQGLNTGADDYLVKPFELDEMLARVRALLRRTTEHKSPNLVVGDIELNTLSHEVYRGKEVITLSPKEYALLEFLMQRQGEVQGRLAIIEHVWGEDADLFFSQTVDVHIAYLRRKLGKTVIKTVPGTGYLIPQTL